MNDIGFNNSYPLPLRLQILPPLLVYVRCYVNIVSLSAALVITVFDLSYSFFHHNLVKVRDNLHGFDTCLYCTTSDTPSI